MDSAVTCAIAGLGRIGSILEKDPLREKPATHAGAIAAHPSTRLAAGADPDGERREEFRTDWPKAAVYADALEMIRNHRPDILHIASWTDTHPDLLNLALDERVPVIVCEKPLADDLDGLDALRDRIAAGSSRIIMNHERRFSADYRKVREMIIDESLGRLLMISCRLYMGRRRPVGRIIYHDGTHMLDILRYLAGNDLEILDAVGDAETEGGSLLIRAVSGDCPICMDVSGGRDHLVFELDLSFTSGRIRIGNGVFEVWESEESPFYTGFRSLVRTRESWDGPTGYFSGMMNHAVALALDPSAESESSLEDGYRVLELIRDVLALAGRSD